MIRRAQPWLGTLVEITVRDGATATGAEAALQRAIGDAFAEIALVQRLMSFYDPDSDLSRLNRVAPGAVIAVSAHTVQVLRLAEHMRLACDGIFNIACAPQLVRWDCLPAPHAARPAYDPHARVVEVDDDNTVRKLGPGWIDLGGIAKGYAVDLAIAALARAGVQSACVNAGGDLRAIGEHGFEVRLRAPAAPTRAGARLTVREAALATSATYFSAREHEGASVSDLVDGRDGTPMLTKSSVSVRAASCAVADALTKVVLASGRADHPALAVFGATALII
jgi:thiamine biosynthesis lipoprotein